MTTEIRLGHCSYLGDAWSILDCPGSIEFAHEMCAALAMVDIAVVVCEPVAKARLTVAPVLKLLADKGVPHIVFINKIDTLDGSVADTLAGLQAYAPVPLVLRQVPIFEGQTVNGYVDLVSERAYRYRKGQASELMQIPSDDAGRGAGGAGPLVETLADRDDALLEKVLEDIKPTPEELYRDMRKDLLAGAVIEVLLGAAENANGVRRLWKALRHDTPDPAETAERQGDRPGGSDRLRRYSRPSMPAIPASCPMPGSGAARSATARHWAGRGSAASIVSSNGELTKVPEAKAGDIVAFGRLDGVPTGATVSPGAHARTLAVPAAAAAGLFDGDRHHRPKDDVKLSGALQKLAEEDPSLLITQAQERRDRAARPGRDASATHGGPPGQRLRPEGDDPQAAGRLQGDDPQAGARAWAAEDARPADTASSPT